MAAITIPIIFFEKWFWFSIAIPLVIIVHFLRKKSPPTFPNAGKFLRSHKVTLRKVADVLLICMILFLWLFPLSFGRDVFKSFSQTERFLPETLKFDQALLLISLILSSGQSCFFLGLISVFQSNLTTTKRIILLFACLLPIIFAVLLLLIDNKTLGFWSIVRLCLNCSILSWIFNAPAIFLNKPSGQFVEGIVQKLKSSFGNHAI